MSSFSGSASVLIEALPYIQRFNGKIVVIKYGGSVLSSDGDSLETFAADVALIHSVGMKPVVVHGGGPQIDRIATALGVESRFVDGLRVTGASMLEAVQMGLLGLVNPEIVRAINRHGDFASGVSGVDGSSVLVRPKDERLGFVGEVVSVDPSLLSGMVDDGVIPVVASIAVDSAGQLYNVNADTLASSVAAALGAEKLIYLSNVPGVLRDPQNPATLINQIRVGEIAALIESGIIGGGMIPKVTAARDAVEGGVARVHMIDGRVPHSLLLELLTDRGVGTMFSGD